MACAACGWVAGWVACRAGRHVPSGHATAHQGMPQPICNLPHGHAWACACARTRTQPASRAPPPPPAASASGTRGTHHSSFLEGLMGHVLQVALLGGGGKGVQQAAVQHHIVRACRRATGSGHSASVSVGGLGQPMQGPWRFAHSGHPGRQVCMHACVRACTYIGTWCRKAV